MAGSLRLRLAGCPDAPRRPAARETPATQMQATGNRLASCAPPRKPADCHLRHPPQSPGAAANILNFFHTRHVSRIKQGQTEIKIQPIKTNATVPKHRATAYRQQWLTANAASARTAAKSAAREAAGRLSLNICKICLPRECQICQTGNPLAHNHLQQGGVWRCKTACFRLRNRPFGCPKQAVSQARKAAMGQQPHLCKTFLARISHLTLAGFRDAVRLIDFRFYRRGCCRDVARHVSTSRISWGFSRYGETEAGLPWLHLQSFARRICPCGL